MLVWGNHISIFVLMCDCPPCPFSSLVIVDLQQANLITSKEYTEATVGEGLSRARDVATGGKGLSRARDVTTGGKGLSRARDVVTGGEGLSCARDVVKIQSSKSTEVMTKTAEVLRRRGFDKESEFLSGKQV